MISIFYSTRESNKKVYNRIKKSCALNGVEIIEFVNNGTYSLAQAYNHAIEKSKHQTIVCIHDDIHLEKGWDKKVLNYFESSEYGILGLAGTTNLPQNGMWWQNKNRMVGRVFHPDSKGRWHESKYSQKIPNEIIETVCVDGLFIAINKNRIKAIFDERFDGFHFYDIPFCVLNHTKGVKVGVITDIVVKHDSIGVPNQKWFDNRDKFAELYSDVLPIDIVPEIPVIASEVTLKIEPKLGIIIPSKNNFEYLEKCIRSLVKTNYTNYTIYLADTGSDEETLEKIKSLYKEINADREILRLIRFDFYHFSKINNQVVENHMDEDTELILFCNDDIEMINDAISLMVKQYNKHKKHVGTIGCRLYYGDNSIQHGGIQLFLTKDKQIGLTHTGIKSYYKASFNKEYDVFGNTGAFLMINRDVFFSVRGFTHETEECMEDVALNIDCIVKNLKNIYIGEAVCYHHESVTRSKNPSKAKKEKEDFVNVLIPRIQKNILKLKKYIKVLR